MSGVPQEREAVCRDRNSLPPVVGSTSVPWSEPLLTPDALL